MMRGLAVCAILLLAISSTVSGASAQSANRGKHVFRKCLLCHVLEPNVTDQIAPPLHNIIGRRAGRIKGFVYSDIMKYAGSQDFIWTREALSFFLDTPEVFMPGTYMAFAGLELQERRDVIAYLEKLTRDFKRSQRRKRRSSLRQRLRARSSGPGKFSPVQ